jgi:hypothetical protein
VVTLLLAPANGVGATALALFAPTPLSLGVAAGVATSAMKLSAPSVLSLLAAAGVGNTALTLGTAVVLQLKAAGVGDSSLALSTPMLLVLEPSQGVGDSRLTLKVSAHATEIGTATAGTEATGSVVLGTVAASGRSGAVSVADAAAGSDRATARLVVIGATAKIGEEP